MVTKPSTSRMYRAAVVRSVLHHRPFCRSRHRRDVRHLSGRLDPPTQVGQTATVSIITRIRSWFSKSEIHQLDYRPEAPGVHEQPPLHRAPAANDAGPHRAHGLTTPIKVRPATAPLAATTASGLERPPDRLEATVHEVGDDGRQRLGEQVRSTRTGCVRRRPRGPGPPSCRASGRAGCPRSCRRARRRSSSTATRRSVAVAPEAKVTIRVSGSRSRQAVTNPAASRSTAPKSRQRLPHLLCRCRRRWFPS